MRQFARHAPSTGPVATLAEVFDFPLPARLVLSAGEVAAIQKAADILAQIAGAADAVDECSRASDNANLAAGHIRELLESQVESVNKTKYINLER